MTPKLFADAAAAIDAKDGQPLDLAGQDRQPAPIAPWHDCPPCHTCRGPMITRAEHDRGEEFAVEHSLICCSCGDGHVGTPAEVAQAERARDAWEQHMADSRARGPLPAMPFDPELFA